MAFWLYDESDNLKISQHLFVFHCCFVEITIRAEVFYLQVLQEFEFKSVSYIIFHGTHSVRVLEQ